MTVQLVTRMYNFNESGGNFSPEIYGTSLGEIESNLQYQFVDASLFKSEQVGAELYQAQTKLG